MIHTFKELIQAYAPSVDDFTFLQIGANDGLVGDPLHSFINEYAWRGVLVEPQRAVFEERLLRNHADNDRLVFKNVAIDEVDGERELFVLSFSNERWATGLASFKRSHLERHIDNGYVQRMMDANQRVLPDDPAALISTELVQTMSFTSLLDECEIDSLHLLQIDTEGYDYQLLQLFDFEQVTPAVIQYEKHVMPPHERELTIERLHHYGYLLFNDYINMVAVRRDVVDRLALEIAEPV